MLKENDRCAQNLQYDRKLLYQDITGYGIFTVRTKWEGYDLMDK